MTISGVVSLANALLIDWHVVVRCLGERRPSQHPPGYLAEATSER